MKRFLSILFLVSILFMSCQKVDSKKTFSYSEGQPMSVVTTTMMIGDVAANIGGERVQVYSMMGSGVDPHLYKAKVGDLSRLTKADLILYNGIHLEAKMGDVLEKLSQTQNIVAIAEGIPEETLIITDHAYDPHIWFDVANWIHASSVILDALIKTDPEGLSIYKANHDIYTKKLEELDRSTRAKAMSLSQEQRILVTAHDAFNYFGRAYGFEVKGLQGISTVDEAGTSDVRSLADFIVLHRIPALFIESSVSPKSIKALQAAVKARGWNVEIGGELYSDAMGSEGTQEGTYIGMVTHNIDTIVQGLSLEVTP